MTYLLGNNLMD